MRRGSLTSRLSRQLEQFGLPRDAACLLGYSCGADSTALLHLLRDLPHPWHLRLHLAHFNHGLRPDSRKEEQFARQEAKRLSLPITCGRPVGKMQPGESLEGWARIQRWSFFKESLKKTGSDYLLLAHHADDVVETALMRLMEGASPGAVAGLRGERGQVLRPLVGFRKAELRDWLLEKGQKWFEDSSNQDPGRFRNRVRLELLPVLEAVSPGGLLPITRSLETLREEMAVLEETVSRGLGESLDPEGQLNLRLLREKLHPTLALQALAWHLSHQGLRPGQAQLRQVMKIVDQMDSPRATGQRQLGFLGPGGWYVSKTGLLVKKDTKSPEKGVKKARKAP